MEKIKVDLDDPIWLSEPGYGSSAVKTAPYCALGKFGQVVKEFNKEHYSINGISTPHQVWTTNDDKVDGSHSPDNHWKAVRILLEFLASKPEVFELVGSKVSDIVKEKVNVEIV